LVLQSTKEPSLLTSGNSEVDKKIGGGLPPNSLTLIEGQPDSGKSVLVQQFIWGCLQAGKRITLYTTENTTPSLLRQMRSLALDVDDFFLMGWLDVFPVPNSFPDDADSLYLDLLHHIAGKKVDVVFVDALTAFASHASEKQTLDFFSRAKEVCDTGVSLVVTLHSYATTEQMLTRLSSICDAHLRLRVEDLGTQLVKVIEVSKVRGATKTTGNVISFDVEPNFGIKIIPVTKAKA
jgi:flagellar protein FlaH